MTLHCHHLHRIRILHFRRPRRIRPRRRLVHTGRSLRPERLVRPHFVVIAAKTIQLPLLRPPVLSRPHLLLQRAVHALMPAVLLRMSGLNRSGTIPSLIHHTASRDNPPTVAEAKGGPLSVRITSGSPYSRKAASKMARTRSVSVFSTACERSRYRLHASLMVNGSTRAPRRRETTP